MIVQRIYLPDNDKDRLLRKLYMEYKKAGAIRSDLTMRGLATEKAVRDHQVAQTRFEYYLGVLSEPMTEVAYELGHLEGLVGSVTEKSS